MIDRADLDALIAARHSDPFAVLGPHAADDGRLWLHALLPGAETVEAIDPATGASLARLAARIAGLYFEAPLDGERRPYRLRVRWQHGASGDYADPYAFGPSLGAQDLHFLGEGSHLRPWQVLGAHPMTLDGVAGTRFALWAPNASRVSVVGDFNGWDGRRHPMRVHHGGGIWEIFLPHVGAGDRYKYEIRTRDGTVLPLKSDPYAFACEMRPASASVVAAPARRGLPPARAQANRHDAPMAAYEVHLGSWRRRADGGFLDWDELADQLPAYAADLGFTHLELLPVAEHPFDGSWGYQVTGLYAPTARFGDAQGFGRFLDACHARGIGVIVDWVPAHFPTDAHGLARFDGTALYEYADPREGFHRDWSTLIYNFGRHEVKNFLVGNALYWLQQWGVDGLRVDAVASMLYRDYSREAGDWVPNAFGGRENLEAIAFLKRMNEVTGAEVPGSFTVAEESTAWPGVSRPTSTGGLGFHYKWNMGWMHDTLQYFSKEPVHRRWHHNELTFSLIYAFHENFVLPLSHDEVVHGKGSLLNKMPGDRWQKFANLRLLLSYMWTHPGKKLLFMGGEFGQSAEWNHDVSLDWHLLQYPEHAGVQALVRDLNRLYTSRPALHRCDHSGAGFEWIDANDADSSALAYLRKDGAGGCVLVVCNFTPVPRQAHVVGVPQPGRWREIFNSDSRFYAGSDLGNGAAPLQAQPVMSHGRSHSLRIALPPLAVAVFEPVAD
jgi:1,4-alpha-glucan branching enzyme